MMKKDIVENRFTRRLSLEERTRRHRSSPSQDRHSRHGQISGEHQDASTRRKNSPNRTLQTTWYTRPHSQETMSRRMTLEDVPATKLFDEYHEQEEQRIKSK